MKVVLYGPDAPENARLLRAAHARARLDSPGVVLRKVHGDGEVLAPGATVLFFDAPLGRELFGRPLHLHLFTLEGEPRAEHLAVILAGADGVVFVPGTTATTKIANLDNLRAFFRQASHALPTVVVRPEPDESEKDVLDRAVAAIVEIFREHLVDA